MATFEYMTFPGNGEIVATVFNSVAMLSGSSMMAGAAQAASLFGFIVVIAVAAFKLDLRESMSWIFGIFFIWMGLMVPKSTVLVTEAAGYGFTANQHAVANVPFGLAAGSSLVSQFGLEITRKMEQIYTIPGELNYTQTGILFGNRLYEQIYGAKITDQRLTQDWALFTENCTFFDLNLYGFFSIDELRHSPSIIDTLGKTNQAMFTNVSNYSTFNPTTGQFKYTGTSTTKSCIEAHSDLANRTKLTMSSVTNQVANKLFGQAGINAIGPNKAALLQSIGNQSMQYLLNDARFDTVKSIEQTAMMEMLRQTDHINYQRHNNNAAAQEAMALTLSRNQYITAQKTGAAMASWNLPLFRSMVEAILLGIFPMVIIGALLGGATAFKSLMYYLTSLLWIQLWAPVGSIINLVMTVHSRSIMSAEAAISGTGNVTGGTSYSLMAAAVDGQSAAGAAFWLIPVISGALVFGGRAMTQSMMGMVTGGKSTSDATGTQMGSGNTNYGNMSTNNVSANKYAADPVYTSSSLMTTSSVAGTSYQDGAGGGSRYQGRSDSLGNISGTSTISLGETYSQMASQSTAAAQNYSAQAQASTSVGNSQALAWGASYATSQSSSNGYGLNLSAQDSRAMDEIQKSSQKLSNSNSLGTTSQYASIISLGLSKTNSGSSGESLFNDIKETFKGLGFKGEKNAQNIDKAASNIASEVQSLHDNGVSLSQSAVDSITNSSAFKDDASRGNSLASSATANFAQAEQATLASTQSYQEAQAYQEQASQATATNATVSIDNAKAIKEYADQNGITMQEVYDNPSMVAAAAMGAAVGNVANLNQSAEGTPFAVQTSLAPQSKPENNVASAHQANIADLQGKNDANRQSITEQALASGLSGSSVDSRVEGAESSLKQDFNAARANVNEQISGGQQSYSDDVDHLGGKATQMGKAVETIGMRLNSQQIDFDTKAAQQESRSVSGNLGSGYDAAFAAVVDNKGLASNMKKGADGGSLFDQPGNTKSSGSITFAPKE